MRKDATKSLVYDEVLDEVHLGRRDKFCLSIFCNAVTMSLKSDLPKNVEK